MDEENDGVELLPSDRPSGQLNRRRAVVPGSPIPCLDAVTARYPFLTQNRIFVGLLVFSLALLVLILVLVLPSGSGTDDTDGRQLYEQLAGDYWADVLATYPLQATYVGVKGEINGRLTNLSWAAIEAAAGRRHELYVRSQRLAQRLDDFGDDAAGLLNAQLLIQLIDYAHQRDQYLELDNLLPVSTMTGPQLDLPSVVDVTDFATASDYEHYVQRLGGMADYIDQCVALLQRGVAGGITQPCDFVGSVPEQIRAQLVDDPLQSDFYRPFADDQTGVSTPAQRQTASRLIADSVLPAYRRLLAYFTDVYLHACHTGTTPLGLGALPNGTGYYAVLVAEFTTDAAYSPQAVYALGVQQVQLVRQQMQAALARANYTGPLRDYLDQLRAAQQYVLPAQQLLDYTRSFAKQIDALLPGYFALLPRCPYAIRPVPSGVDASQPAGYYNEPDAECSRPGYFYLNTYAGKVPTYLLPSLFLHEAVPGHHLQLALAAELTGLPPFRTYGADWTAFIEGWAHFAEYFGEDMGLYDDPATDIGRLSDAMLRACRLVIDSGIHAGNMTRSQAVDLLVANSALSIADINAEVDRYGSWPGQATAYRTGALKFFALRDRAMAQLGDRFDRRHFYSALLANGALPMNMLDPIVDQFIQDHLHSDEE